MSSNLVPSAESTTERRPAGSADDNSMDAGLQEANANLSQLTSVIDSLKKEAEDDRCVYIKKRMEENRLKLAEITKNLHMSFERRNVGIINGGKTDNLLTKKQKDAIAMQKRNGISSSSQEEEQASVVLLKSGSAVKNSVPQITLPKVEKIPRYTTWVFINRNEIMREDQSVVGQRRIYYERNGVEALICSDSEEETADDEDEKHEFVESEDKIIWSTIEQTGSSETVFNLLAQCLSRKPCEIKERYEALKCPKPRDIDSNMMNSFLDKDLETNQDSLNKLFCRRCFIFGCTLHGCSQQLIYPAEKKSSTRNRMDKEEVPCSPHCYLQLEGNSGISSMELATDFESWGTLEKSLFDKGIEIFGRKSCLIARNLIGQLKTCVEVYHALQYHENKLRSGSNMGTALRKRSSLKLVGSNAIRKHSSRKDLQRRQYNPCGCRFVCGNDCPCLANDTCCEKYCGCPKACKNRFKGCQCAKSQCRSRQCPCFAADRECDPDICRHCWISCGDGTLGSPSNKANNSKCQNMNLLSNRRKQRLLLGRSDVSGWGVFLKNSVAKDEYLGEYTGELISHREADKRGKIYDLQNSSFLFNLNDQFVLDAKRKGNKLKFINHSSDPNTYAKVMMVAGDHRVAIFAKKEITAGEELFFDYSYDPDKAPSWAKKPEDCGSRKEDTTSSSTWGKKKLG